jgi:hypothetical protein
LYPVSHDELNTTTVAVCCFTIYWVCSYLTYFINNVGSEGVLPAKVISPLLATLNGPVVLELY